MLRWLIPRCVSLRISRYLTISLSFPLVWPDAKRHQANRSSERTSRMQLHRSSSLACTDHVRNAAPMVRGTKHRVGCNTQSDGVVETSSGAEPHPNGLFNLGIWVKSTNRHAGMPRRSRAHDASIGLFVVPAMAVVKCRRQTGIAASIYVRCSIS